MGGYATDTSRPAPDWPGAHEPLACREKDWVSLQVTALIGRAQFGDEEARWALTDGLEKLRHATTARLITRFPVEDAAEMAQDLQGEGVLALVALVEEYDFWRGVNPFVYLERKLTGRLLTAVRVHVRDLRREQLPSQQDGAVSDPNDETGEDGTEMLDRARLRGEGPTGQWETHEDEVVRRLDLTAAVAALPANQRAVIDLVLKDFTLRAIAAMLRISVAACEKRYQRAVRSLAQALGKPPGGESGSAGLRAFL